MALVSVVGSPVVVGVLLWLVNAYIAMDGTIQEKFTMAMVVVVVLGLLNGFRVLGCGGNPRGSKPSVSLGIS